MYSIETDILTIRQHFPSAVNPTSSYWVYEQVKEIEKYGITFIVISPVPYLPKFLQKKISKRFPNPSSVLNYYNGIKTIRPGYYRIPKHKLYPLTNYFLQKSILSASNNIKPKLIHAHFGNDGIAALSLKEKKQVPLITSFYGYDLSDNLQTFLKYYHVLKEKGDLFLALSNDMKNDMIKIGFPESKIVIHHLGVNYNELSALRVRKKNNNNDNNFTFLCVARFIEGKGIHDTIKAFSSVNMIYPHAQLCIMGDGGYKYELINLVQQLNLNNSVTFVNNFITPDPRGTVLNAMVNCDVFILTSYTTLQGLKEGTPVVLMEAQSMGKPCISTVHAGIPEIVKNNETGILCKERDINEISQAMITLIENKMLYIKYSENGAKHIQQEFNNEIQIKKLYNLYSSFL